MKKVCATGPGSARPVVSITTRSKSSSPFALPGGEVRQRRAQILADGAAHAAVVELDDLLAALAHQDVAVDVLVAELVLDHRDLLAVRLGEHALEQGGLAEPRKPVRMVAGIRAMEGNLDEGGQSAPVGAVTVVQGPGLSKRRALRPVVRHRVSFAPPLGTLAPARCPTPPSAIVAPRREALRLPARQAHPVPQAGRVRLARPRLARRADLHAGRRREPRADRARVARDARGRAAWPT